MCSASALLRIDDPDGVADRATEAIRLHPADQTGSLVDMTARADLAQAELARGNLDAAESSLGAVWSLPAGHRRYSLVGRLEAVATALAAPRYLKAAAATALTQRIREFAEDSASSAGRGSGTSCC
jgi:ATP/maltotriose-dependent transcriptional regulator MalT